MATRPIKRLTPVSIKEGWNHEEEDFTPWLAEEDNIQLLCEKLGLNLEVLDTEVRTGGLRADILCRNLDYDSDDDSEEASEENSYVIIENQFKKSDNKHLGQILAYAANLKAPTVIWIAEEFTEDYKNTLDWLNEITPTGFSFFGVQIKLLEIKGCEAVAPNFDIISQPDDFRKSTIRKKQEVLSANKKLQHKYWKSLSEYLKEEKSKANVRTPRPRQHSHITSFGKHTILRATISTQKEETSIILLLGKDMKRKYDEFNEKREELESKFGLPLEFIDSVDDATSASIRLKRSFAIENNEDDWEDSHKWFRQNLEIFIAVFKPLFKKSN